MILNQKTGSHDMYLQAPRRAQRVIPPRAEKPPAGNPQGSLSEKCAWLKARQEARALQSAKEKRMLSPSRYLNVQARLLIMIDELRKLPLEEFVETAEHNGRGGIFIDHDGLPVSIAVGVVQIARAAQDMVSCGPHAQRKPVESERAEVREMRRVR